MRNQKGQTIIEAVVAIAVIALAMLGFLSQATSNLVMGRISENHLIAQNLAAEAIEVARNIRDSNWMKGCLDPADVENCILWNSGLADKKDYSAVLNFNAQTGGWILDFAPDNLLSCGGDCLLKLKDGAYVLAAGEKTKFSRMVFLRPVCKNKADCDGGVCDDGKSCASGQIGIAVEVQVGWSESGGAKTFSATEYLYNWR